jgi:flagellin
MSEIVLSSAVRSNLLNLQSTAELLGKTQTRLATGKKVNTALDNATHFFTASSLNSRAADLGRLLDSVSNAVQTIAAADKGISAITKLVESAQATARQALQTAATLTANTPATIAGNIDVSNDTAAITTGTLNLGTDVSAGTTGSTAVLAGDATSTVVSAGNTLAVTIGGGSTFTITFNSGGANTNGDIDIANAANDTVGELVGVIQARIRAGGGADAGSAIVNISAGNRIHIDTGLTTNRTLTIADNTTSAPVMPAFRTAPSCSRCSARRPRSPVAASLRSRRPTRPTRSRSPATRPPRSASLRPPRRARSSRLSRAPSTSRSTTAPR